MSLVEQGSRLFVGVTVRSGFLLQPFAVFSLLRRCARFTMDSSSVLVTISYSKLGLCGGVELKLARSIRSGV